MEDEGFVAKKKKERSLLDITKGGSIPGSLMVSEWSQKDRFVNVTFVVGCNQDPSVEVVTEDEELVVCHSDGRKIQVRLFERIDPEATEVSFKGSYCHIKLLKRDHNIEWPSLEFDNSSMRLKNCGSINSCHSIEMVQETNPMFNVAEKVIDISQQARTNFVERNGDPYLTVFLYVPSIRKDNILVNFSSGLITALFSCRDPSFLRNFSSGNEEARFEWSLHPKYSVTPNQCSFKVTPSTLEIKLKKEFCQNWTKLTAHDEASGKSKPENPIPPAPPIPPFLEAKKALSLVSPENKGSLLPLSSLGMESTNLYTRGTVGLDNIGNTCFMNSVLQCLGNTRELRDYFLEGVFLQDLNKENPLGMGGKLAISFSTLMKALWSQNTRSYAPAKLKGVMSLKANQFSGFAQHDAQEFMVELLDGLHEDLNLIKKKPYMAEPPDLDGWPDSEAAEESWRLHKLRNDSIIDDLFKGQFKSTLKCHECNKISVKFDEFCCLSVPIPKDQKIIQVIFFWRNTEKRPRKYSIRVSADALVEEVKLQLSFKTGIHSSSIQIMEAVKYIKIFEKCSLLPNISPSDVLMAFEVLSEIVAGEPVVELAVTQRMMFPSPPAKCSACARPPPQNNKLKRCTKCYRVGYCDTSCQKSHWNSHKQHCKLTPEAVGAPFIVSIERSRAIYSNLNRIIESYARFSVDIFQPPVAQTQATRRRQGSTSSGELSSDAEEMEVDSEGSGGASRDAELESGAYSGEDRAEADWLLSGSSSLSSNGGRLRQRRSSSLSSNSSGGDEIPQLSNSPKGRALPQQRIPNTPATRLFSLRPVNSRSQTIPSPIGDPLTDKGNEPLDLRDVQRLAMDWCTNEKLPVYCFVQNKEIDCETEEEEEEAMQRNKHTSLEACIDLFTQPENLSEGDSWRCPRCKKPVEAMKQMSLWRLPSILIIQLKRFSFKYILHSDKIDKYVEYPLRDLDVRPFMSDGSKEQQTIYDLYGVINHMGRLLGGHYTAYSRTVQADDTRDSEIDWRLCDDSRVNIVNESRVVHEQAYLLLYRRRNDPFVITRPFTTKLENERCEEEEVFEPQQEPMETLLHEGDALDPPCTAQEELD